MCSDLYLSVRYCPRRNGYVLLSLYHLVVVRACIMTLSMYYDP
jgi:hypothetical protein